ncbi:hypothetical protein ACQ86N_38065 [Puia sp. P3]|uniref:hypothetical protein n=1 Tax=Puia sp. P3 TaxID=3423952 RepID=UPI003D669773
MRALPPFTAPCPISTCESKTAIPPRWRSRTHFAQHSYISHVDIFIGNGKAGLYDVGNEMEDVRFFGGDYGIYTTKPSPGWPFMMVDTSVRGAAQGSHPNP